MIHSVRAATDASAVIHAGQIPDLIKQAGGVCVSAEPRRGGGWLGEVHVMRAKADVVAISRVKLAVWWEAAIRSSAAGGTGRSSPACFRDVDC